ncbi:hypothetical protein ACJJTC_000451 [Scirpophaga incertulas]
MCRSLVIFSCFLVLGVTYTTSAEPLQCQGRNKIEECVHSCPPERTCRNLGIQVRCPDPEGKECVRKCVCAPGYYKNAVGDCITKEQCNKCTKPNEFYECGGACDNVCKDLHTQNRTSCPIRNIVCNPRCYCEDDYARDDSGNCIPVDMCNTRLKRNVPEGLTCGQNEELVFGKSCPPDECFALVAKFKCDSKEVDRYMCRCKAGHLRLAKGASCVPICQCPEMKNSPDCI